MSNGLAGRIGRILSGSVHDLIDAWEDQAPELLVDQALGELDQAIDDVRAELGKVIAAKHLASRQLGDERQTHENLTENIRLALDDNRDDLAEAGVAKLLDVESQISVLETTIAQYESDEAELTRYVKALRTRRRELETELKEVLAGQNRAPAPKYGGSGHGLASTPVGGFDRAMRSADAVGGGLGGDGAFRAKLAELDELARAKRISERLARLKAGK